jgi:hypothetical protein
VVSIDDGDSTGGACEVVATVLGPAFGRGEASAPSRDEGEAAACATACRALAVECDAAASVRHVKFEREGDGYRARCTMWLLRTKVAKRAKSCAAAYASYADGALVAVELVDGIGVGQALTSAWDVPGDPGAVACRVEASMVGARATGRAEGESVDGVTAEARSDACEQLGLNARACADAQPAKKSQRFQLVNGKSHSEVELELVARDHVEGRGTGASRLDGCRAALADGCADARCRGRELTVERIDGVPLGPPPSWPQARPLGGDRVRVHRPGHPR